MQISYEDIKKANDSIKTSEINVKGNAYQYVDVAQRIKAFRMVYPLGYIITEMKSNEGGICVFRATVGYTDEQNNEHILGVGTAYEKENSTFINRTSYIENCETSAVGRALGMAGFGIDISVASYEEVGNAIINQRDRSDNRMDNVRRDERKASPKQIEVLSEVYTGENMAKLLEYNGIERIEDLPMSKASELISKLRGDK